MHARIVITDMRVSSAHRFTIARGTHVASAAAGGFRLPAFAGLAETTPTRAVGVVRPTTTAAIRRREALRAGRGLLDALDAIRLDLLDGRGDALPALAGRLAAAEALSGDPELDELLDHIRLRAEVEIAKQEKREQEMRERARDA